MIQIAEKQPVGYIVKSFIKVYVKAVRCGAVLVFRQNLENVIRAPAVGQATVLRLMNKSMKRGEVVELPCRMSGHNLIQSIEEGDWSTVDGVVCGPLFV